MVVKNTTAAIRKWKEETGKSKILHFKLTPVITVASYLLKNSLFYWLIMNI